MGEEQDDLEFGRPSGRARRNNVALRISCSCFRGGMWEGWRLSFVEKNLGFELLVVVSRGGRWEARRRINPTPGLARRRRKMVSAERVHVGKDEGLLSTCPGVFLYIIEGWRPPRRPG